MVWGDNCSYLKQMHYFTPPYEISLGPVLTSIYVTKIISLLVWINTRSFYPRTYYSIYIYNIFGGVGGGLVGGGRPRRRKHPGTRNTGTRRTGNCKPRVSHAAWGGRRQVPTTVAAVLLL